MRRRSEVEGVLLLPLPVCLQSRFQQFYHVLAPTETLLCCYLTEYAGCCVAAGCESLWGHLSETEEQTGSQTARQYSAGCSLPQSGVLWQLSGRVLSFDLFLEFSVFKSTRVQRTTFGWFYLLQYFNIITYGHPQQWYPTQAGHKQYLELENRYFISILMPECMPTLQFFNLLSKTVDNSFNCMNITSVSYHHFQLELFQYQIQFYHNQDERR